MERNLDLKFIGLPPKFLKPLEKIGENLIQSNQQLDFEIKLPMSTPSLEGFEAVVIPFTLKFTLGNGSLTYLNTPHGGILRQAQTDGPTLYNRL